MADKKEVELWLVKDTDGEYVAVRADKWECGGDGLKFFVDNVKVAHFIRWCSYRKLSA